MEWCPDASLQSGVSFPLSSLHFFLTSVSSLASLGVYVMAINLFI